MIQQILIGIAWANGLFLALWAIGAMGCMLLDKLVYHKHLHAPNPFLGAVVGFLLLSFGWAAYKTGGNTVLWLWLFPLFWYIIDDKSSKEIQPWNRGLMYGLLVFGIAWPAFYSVLWFDPEIPNILHFDEVYYVVLSGKMGHFGVENTLPFHPELTPLSASPYHYAELWLLDALFELTGQNRMFLFSVIIKSALSMAACLGVLRLMQTLKASILWQWLGIFSLFFAPFLLDYSHVIQGASMAHQVKSLAVSCILIWFAILVVQRHRHWYLPLFCLPALNIATALVVTGTLAAHQVWYRRWKVVFLTLVYALALGGFYFLQPSVLAKAEALPVSEYIAYYNFDSFVDFAYRNGANLGMYFPFILVLGFGLLLWKPNRRELGLEIKPAVSILVFLLFGLGIGLALIYVTPPFAGENADQMHILFNPFLWHIFILILFWRVYVQLQFKYGFAVRSSLFLSLVIGICIYQTVVFVQTKRNMVLSPRELRSEGYIKQVAHELKNPLEFGVSIMPLSAYFKNYKEGSRGELMNAYWFSPFSTLSSGVLYLANLNTLEDTYSADDLKKLNMGVRKDRMKRYRIRETQMGLKTSLLHLYCREGKCVGEGIGQTQGGFIHDFNPRFIILWDGAEAPFDIKKYSILLDSNSMEKTVILSQ